jgi:hypothetical protein
MKNCGKVDIPGTWGDKIEKWVDIPGLGAIKFKRGSISLKNGVIKLKRGLISLELGSISQESG